MKYLDHVLLCFGSIAGKAAHLASPSLKTTGETNDGNSVKFDCTSVLVGRRVHLNKFDG